MFQKSVLNKYLKGLDSEKLNDAFKRFSEHFQNSEIQENIRNSKEEQYQGEFLIDLFVNVFGYTKNPSPEFNLTTELKNIRGSKKTDGAILKDGKALAVIELKGTKTTDLSKVETQAFGYKNNQAGCNYVITSNFEKLRFYIDNAVEFEEFNLFKLSIERFKILWLCLNSESLLRDIPKKLKNESLTQEENVTKKLYKDYASFRNEIFDTIQKENPKYDKLTLFKKTQKLLDRFLFIFFAEDRLLLPPNSIRSIVKQWSELRDKYDEYFPLYDRFKKYFGYMNTGHRGKQHDIFAYNGGLFAPDEILDSITINDDLLYKHALNLSNYDFESEVSVNILGHIFEHSLNDIDEIQAELEGINVENKKSKRKKDGVFYTPKYITKYIVENTVGELCKEKKTELDIQDVEFEKDRKGRQKVTIKRLNHKLEDYRKWLLQITICDPACGSGAFLNQALEFLIQEHHYIDELRSKLFGDSLILSEVENSILENNLFGVDINEESVEIAKLSLWLRTAQKGRKLTALNNNIKCGNSLIDDPNHSIDKSFNWHDEFPEVFSKGGFNVIIGNPPYGINITKNKKYYRENFNSTQGPFEIYKLFIEQSLRLLKKGGFLGFITPDTWVNLSYFNKLRNIVFTNYTLAKCSESLYDVFEDAVVDTCVFIIKNKKPENLKFIAIKRDFIDEFESEIKTSPKDFILNFNAPSKVINKIDKLELKLDSVCEIWRGMSAYGAKNPDRPFNSYSKDTEFHRKLLNGGDISKYLINWSGEYIKYGEWLHRPRPEYIYTSPKILIQRIRNPKLTDRIIAVFDNEGYISSDGLSNILLKRDTNYSLIKLLGILNSNLINYWFSYYFFDVNIKPEQLRQIPLPEMSNCQNFEKAVVLQLDLNKEFTRVTNQFTSILCQKYAIDKPSRKLHNWYELSFVEFLKDFEKARKEVSKNNNVEYRKLSLEEEAEWMDYFNSKKQIADELKKEIERTNKKINLMVYSLYGLTEEEITIVEEAIV